MLSFITGLITGGIFTLFKLPIPAPSALAGVIGIIGVFVGYVLVSTFIK